MNWADFILGTLAGLILSAHIFVAWVIYIGYRHDQPPRRIV